MLPVVNPFYQYLEKKLESAGRSNRYRELKLPCGIDFSSNDYLCLAAHPYLKEKLEEGVRIYGCGSTASRLVRGHQDIFTQAEEKFSSWIKSETSLFVANGYNANVGLFSSFGPDTIVFTDRLNHASILDGIRLSGADRIYYNHLDLQDLEAKIKQAGFSGKKGIIVSEALFSMDGDIAPVAGLVSIAEAYGLTLIIDEAHSLGVFGPAGNGLVAALGLEDRVDIRVFTMGKAMGLEGAMISGKKILQQFLINSMRSFIFSTAPMPAIAHALLFSIDLVTGMTNERGQLLARAETLRNKLQLSGYNTMNAAAQIIPVKTADERHALELSSALAEYGFDIRAIRPPTVKDSRLRVIIHACHADGEIEKLAGIFSSMKVVV